MKNFIYELYKNDNFTLWLTIALVVLIILFVVVFFFGKKDEKLEETKRLQKLELDAFKKEEEKPLKVEVEASSLEDVKEDDVNVSLFKPDETLDEEEIDLPSVASLKEEEKPLFSKQEEESPLSFSEVDSDVELKEGLTNLENIKAEFDTLEVPEIKDEEEKPIFKPSPQVFSSVFVNKSEDTLNNNEEESITKIEEKEEEKPSFKAFIIEDDEEEVELPTLKIIDDEKTKEEEEKEKIPLLDDAQEINEIK